jgi:hypothetical protein
VPRNNQSFKHALALLNPEEPSTAAQPGDSSASSRLVDASAVRTLTRRLSGQLTAGPSGLRPLY